MKDESYEMSYKLGVEVPDSLLSQIGLPKSVIDSTNLYI